MSIAIFLDVDVALTTKRIQQRFADLLGVKDKYEVIESEFQRTRNSAEFARRLIDLFNSTEFSEEFAAEHYKEVKLQDWTDDLLRLPQEFPVTLYLVSSGPSYYVQRLAKAFDIPQDNVLCSRYYFDTNGKLTRCNAVSLQTKADFVRRHAAKYSYTIGVGDDAKQDGPFISNCDIPIITTQSEGFLYAESL